MTTTEEQRGTVGFDLEKARASIAHYRIENPSNVDTESALKELVDQANLAEDALAEIERLRANEKSLSAVLDRQVQAARIKDLKKEIRRLKHEYKVEVKFTNSYIKRLHDAEARIKELEDALVEERAWRNFFAANARTEALADFGYSLVKDRHFTRAREQLRAEGAIR